MLNPIKDFLKKILIEIVEHSEIQFDPETKQLSLKYKKEI